MPRLSNRVVMAFLLMLVILSIGCCDHCADLMSLAVSQDSKFIASLCGVYSACVWDASTGKLVFRNQLDRPGFSDVALSPTADLLATGWENGTITLWKWRTGKSVSTLKNDIHNELVLSVAFSPNGQDLAAAGLGWPVHVWDVRTGLLIRQLPESAMDFQNCRWQQSRVTWGGGNKPCLPYSLAYSPDGKTIAVGSKLWLRLWDATTGAMLRTYAGAAEIGSIAFSPDGELLASSGEDGGIAVWNARAGTRLRSFQLSRQPLRSIAFSPDGHNLAASGWDGNIYIWDPHADSPIRKIPASDGAVNWVSFSADGAEIISGGRDDNLIVTWQISTGKELRRISCLSTVEP